MGLKCMLGGMLAHLVLLLVLYIVLVWSVDEGERVLGWALLGIASVAMLPFLHVGWSMYGSCCDDPFLWSSAVLRALAVGGMVGLAGGAITKCQFARLKKHIRSNAAAEWLVTSYDALQKTMLSIHRYYKAATSEGFREIVDGLSDDEWKAFIAALKNLTVAQLLEIKNMLDRGDPVPNVIAQMQQMSPEIAPYLVRGL